MKISNSKSTLVIFFILLDLMCIHPTLSAAHLLQWSPLQPAGATPAATDPSNAFGTTTPDPWTKQTQDPWTNPGSIAARTNPTTPQDPWTKHAQDPWTKPTQDPWTNSGSGASKTNPTGVQDSRTKPGTEDTKSDPKISTHTGNSGSRSMPVTAPAERRVPAASEFEAINTINVLTSAYFNDQTTNVNNIYSDTGRLGEDVGSTAGCQRAMRECSLFDADTAALDNVYQQAFASMLKKQRLSYQGNLKKMRDFFINLFNQFILNPDLAPDSKACIGADLPVFLQNDPVSNLPQPSSIRDISVPPLKDCVVSEWSAWSLPLAFGVVERRRSIVQPGQCCPQPEELVEQVNISSYLNQNNNAFENPNNVAENFNNDFLNTEPRDILLIIDTSSSIYIDDFELMKDGIKAMIDLFCGSFGYSDSNNRLAILQFSDKPVVVHYFSDPQTPAELKAKVSQMVDFGGRTCTGDALLAAHDEVFRVDRGARAHMPNDTLIVTDGHANCGADLLKSARTLAGRSSSVYALGVSIASDVAARAQVTSLVTNQDPHHIFSLARYVDFKEMVLYIKYRQDGQTCTPIVARQQHTSSSSSNTHSSG